VKLLLLLLVLAGQLELEPLLEKARKDTGAPEVAVAVVRAGQTQLAGPSTPFAIGSVSKQFTAAAVLHLVEEGRLRLDDRVAKWLPGLTRAQDVSLRQLLSMTAGYRDYWPQDYVMPMMLQPITPLALVERWAGYPLDFEPGTAWQYSNTNYVIAGVIVEKVSGKPLFENLREWVFKPLAMQSVREVDRVQLTGYRRFALGPPRPAPQTAPGWLFAAGGLAMTPADLARWNVSVMRQSLLKPSSYAELTRDTLLANGVGTGYGLGIEVANRQGRRLLTHGGEISGFTTTNHILPDDSVAVTVVANLDASDVTAQVANRVLELVFAPAGGGEADVRRLLGLLAEGEVDAALLTANCQAYFSPEARADYAATLKPLGALKNVTLMRESKRGGMVYRGYRVQYPDKTLRLSTYVTPDGKLEQFLLLP